MNEREARMRCIEALAAFGVRETDRIIRDAAKLAEWVMAGEVEADKPRVGRPPKQD